MPRLFVGNFDFEHRLAEPGRQLPIRIDRINAELASCWLAIAEDGDFLWTPRPIAMSFFEQLSAAGLPQVVPINSFDQAPPGAECVPWGWTDEIRRLCDRYGWVRHDPPDRSVRAANARRTSALLEQEWQVGLERSGPAASVAEVSQRISQHPSDARWVIKAEYGMSGRERITGTGPLTLTQQNWIRKRLATDEIVFFEPWVESLCEVGIQIHIPPTGDPELIQTVPLLVNPQGQYAGSLFLADPDLTPIRDWLGQASAIDVAVRAAGRLQAAGYFGPLGIDAMVYRAADHSIRVRPLQDINARWTMGRLSLGWKRFRDARDRIGIWCHYSGDRSTGELTAAAAVERFRDTSRLIRAIRTSGREDQTRETSPRMTTSDSEYSASGVTPGSTLPRQRPAAPHGFRRVVSTSPEVVDDQPATHQSLIAFQ